MQLIVDSKSIRRANNGNITGKICLEHEGIFFPDRDWNDFVNIILNWWLEGLLNLLSDETNGAEFSFMDGSFDFFIKKDFDDKSWLIEFRDGKAMINSNNQKLDLISFVQSSLKESNELLRFYKKNNIRNAEINKLQMNYTNLQKFIAQLDF